MIYNSPGYTVTTPYGTFGVRVSRILQHTFSNVSVSSRYIHIESKHSNILRCQQKSHSETNA